MLRWSLWEKLNKLHSFTYKRLFQAQMHFFWTIWFFIYNSNNMFIYISYLHQNVNLCICEKWSNLFNLFQQVSCATRQIADLLFGIFLVHKIKKNISVWLGKVRLGFRLGLNIEFSIGKNKWDILDFFEQSQLEQLTPSQLIWCLELSVVLQKV